METHIQYQVLSKSKKKGSHWRPQTDCFPTYGEALLAMKWLNNELLNVKYKIVEVTTSNDELNKHSNIKQSVQSPIPEHYIPDAPANKKAESIKKSQSSPPHIRKQKPIPIVIKPLSAYKYGSRYNHISLSEFCETRRIYARVHDNMITFSVRNIKKESIESETVIDVTHIFVNWFNGTVGTTETKKKIRSFLADRLCSNVKNQEIGAEAQLDSTDRSDLEETLTDILSNPSTDDIDTPHNSSLT